MNIALVPWVLSIMLQLEPSAPWESTFAETAFAIVDAAEERPLFRGPRAVEETALLLVAVAKFESDFDPVARGDHGASIGLFQVNRAHAPEGDLLTPGRAARVALGLMETSFRICKAHPVEERLGWYAWGRDGCDHALEKSKHRVGLAERLLREHPRKEVSDAEEAGGR